MTNKQAVKLAKEYVRYNGFEGTQTTSLKQEVEMAFDERGLLDSDIDRIVEEIEKLKEHVMI